jgi:hypothetical protein
MTAWLAGLIAPALAGPPVEPSVKALVRVLSYDRALPIRTTDSLVVGVVYDPTDPISAAQGADVLATLRSLDTFTVAGLDVGPPVPLPLAHGGWHERLDAVSAVVVCQVDGSLAGLREAADVLDRPTLGLDVSRVGTGVAIAVAQKQARLEIVIDLSDAKAEGMQPSPELLELAVLQP